MDILEAAIHLFARRGFLATTMADLSRAIRMTPGALYWHFPTKEDLLLAAIEELHQRCVREFRLLGNYQELSAQEQFQAISERAHLLLREHREYGIFFAMLAAEAADSNDQVAEAIRDKLALYATTLKDIIRHGQETGEFRQDVDALHAAHSLLGGFLERRSGYVEGAGKRQRIDAGWRCVHRSPPQGGGSWNAGRRLWSRAHGSSAC
ncbi:TetR/AcrR family transcriptional regulator [Myxococcus vastator]|uniref:TetR/AcrR family transcriptional regulator n=1 Tax=Myxococcus vastator TaxID=2709664 RepID=UPI001F07F7E3|nr:TetR/AcrR family transcriptional regulator [Myxococcus vastator]